MKVEDFTYTPKPQPPLSEECLDTINAEINQEMRVEIERDEEGEQPTADEPDYD